MKEGILDNCPALFDGNSKTLGLKHMLTVKQLARLGGTTPNAVRYYTRRGLLKPERHPNNGYRMYQPRDARWLRFLRQAKQLGFTLNEIGEILQEARQGHSPCPRVRTLLQQRIEENRRRLGELMSLQSRMEDALEEWSAQPDGVPDGHSVCHLIESYSADHPDQSADDCGKRPRDR
jgi:DNA-binding transcriptional MerR regulator